MVTATGSSTPFAGAARLDAAMTLPRWFWQVANQRGSEVAMRWKQLGIWDDISWRSYAEAAMAVGCALLANGARRGDRLVVLSDGRPQWCQAEFGAMGVGVLSVGLAANDSAAQVAVSVNDCAARWLLVQDQEQLYKVLSVLAEMPSIEKIVYFDGTGLHAFTHSQVSRFDAFLAQGQQYHQQHPQRWDTELHAGCADDAATVVYTSGSTGAAKAVVLSHRNLMFQLQAMELACPGMAGDEQLSFLSMAGVVERCFSVYRALQHGAVVHFGKGLPTLMENLREVSPQVVLAVPRVGEKLYATVMMGIAQGTAAQRWAFHRALELGHQVGECRVAGQAVPLGLALRHSVAARLVLDRVRSQIGLRRARALVSVAAPMAPELVRWFRALGLSLVEVYGLTECAGVATFNRPGDKNAGTMGQAVPGTELKVADDGEILLRSPQVFSHYLNQPGLTQAVRQDGWLRTGDMGRIDSDGCLTVTARRQDAITAANGSVVNPSELEANLKLSPYIADAIVVGGATSPLACLLMIEHDAVARYAGEKNLVFTSYASLTRSAEVRQLLQLEVERVNRDLAPALRLRNFGLADTEITVLDVEMTPTLQLRRRLVLQKYDVLVRSLHADAGT